MNGIWTRGISSGTIFRLEGLVILAGICIAYWAAPIRFQPVLTVEKWLRLIAGKRRLAILASGLLPIILRLLLMPVLGVPEPSIQEEFSYLLEGDTFAQGRLTNPPHPMAAFFDTFQELQHPTYCSIRPPGQGLFLAAGEALTGISWIGVVLSVGAFCSALCWMLQGWVTPPWALLGALLAGLRLGVLSNWMNSYWGGAVTALGGLLVLGALPRIRRKPGIASAACMGIGIAILANTRIYEGLFVLIPVAVSLLFWLARDNSFPWRRKLTVAATLTFACLSLAGFIAYYNFRTTGKPSLPPYVLYASTYNPAPAFIWQKVERRSFTIPEMTSFYIDWSLPYFNRMTGKDTFWREAGDKLFQFWSFYLRWALTLPLLAIPWLLPQRRLYVIWAILGVSVAGGLLEVWGAPYYFAALTGVVYLLIVEGLRSMRRWKPAQRPVGEFLGRWVALTVLGIFLLSAALQVEHIRIKDAGINFFSPGPNPMHPRAVIKNRLENMDGRHLLIVRYSPVHNPHEEWVWNRSDPDRAKIVWARDLGPEKEKQLIRYYKDRHIWLIEPDRAADRLTPVKESF
ncbi:MAG: hypothetical protein M3Z09_18735 [Acidobacteriota bacterium]|nr:hypothetical protein [Acidobacteriota bacterium]